MYGIATLLIPPLLTACMAAIGVWWKDRRDRRDRDKERHRVLTQVREEIGAIEAWVTAYNLVASDAGAQEQAKMTAKSDLDMAYGRLR